MKKYSVYLSKETQADINELADFIATVLKAPITAKRYAEGIIRELVRLEKYAGSIHVAKISVYKGYGNQLRRVNYKSHSIIYSIRKNIVIVHRIILQSSIKD